MCGYISIISEKPRKFDMGKIAAALKAMHHRDPDEETVWVDPNGLAAFGYVRLSLVGLSNGTQPLATSDQGIIMMVTGELYEHKQIRQQLEKEYCVFKTSSDSEIALYLYKSHIPHKNFKYLIYKVFIFKNPKIFTN